MQNAASTRPARLAIATLPGLDHFVLDLARDLPEFGVLDVQVFSVRSTADITAILAWTNHEGDAVWLEFCWPPFPALVDSTDFGHRRVLVRVHRIEAYETEHVAQTNWSRVHDLILVSSDMARVVREVRPGIDQQTRLHVVYNGVDALSTVPRLDFDRHRIGWCGSFTARKNPALALQVLHELRTFDRQYRLHIATQLVDRLTTESFYHQLELLDLVKAVNFDGRLSADEMPAWHSLNGILLSTSLHESFGYAIAEAAAAGCDIAVLDYRGAEEFWPIQRRFVTVGAAVSIIRESNPNRWCKLIADRFTLERQVAALRVLLATPRVAASLPDLVVPWSTAYWDSRYRHGGNSGSGSSGRLAQFKAETINRLVVEHGISSVVEFGCGDGRQLALAEYPDYVGVDVSAEAVRLCSERFVDDPSKRFITVDENPGEADLSLSLDVIFHLVEDDVFHRYMNRLFAHARRFVAIYASDQDALTPDAHVRHRNFSAWITQHAPQWQCVLHVPNPHPFDPHAPDETSFADFQLFARKVGVEPAKLPSVITDTTLQGWPVHRGSTRFLLAPHPSSEDAITSFTGVGEAATLEFFDAVLPRCKRMIDVGAYVGAMSLYAASTVPEVHAIEASPTHQMLLNENLRRNPELAARITLHPVALGVADGSAPLFRKAHADSGSSLFEVVERGKVMRGTKETDVPVRDARTMLETIGVDAATLIKIDIEGAEYEVLPALAAMFAAKRPLLQVSFHPFNVVRTDPYRTALARVSASIRVAEALAEFPHIYLPKREGANHPSV